METKTCSKCGFTMSLDHFYQDKRRGGFRNPCKHCVRKESKDYYYSTLDYQHQRGAAFRAENPEHAREWRKANADYLKQYDAERYLITGRRNSKEN